MKILNITYNIVNNIIKIHIKVPILYDEKNINNTNISNNNICINNLDNDKLNLIELFNLQINKMSHARAQVTVLICFLSYVFDQQTEKHCCAYNISMFCLFEF